MTNREILLDHPGSKWIKPRRSKSRADYSPYHKPKDYDRVADGNRFDQLLEDLGICDVITSYEVIKPGTSKEKLLKDIIAGNSSKNSAILSEAQQKIFDNLDGIVQKLVDKAMEGDTMALKMALDRVLPTIKQRDGKVGKGANGVTINITGTDKLQMAETIEAETIEDIKDGE